MSTSLIRWLELPPTWLIAAMALAWGIKRALPVMTIDHPAFFAAGSLLILAGIGLMIWCALNFRQQQTSIIPRRTPSALITGGPYRISRNPIYLADAIILVGWVALIGAPLALIVLPLFVVAINRRFIVAEEAVLAAEFGEEFATWRARVRRWI